MKKNNKGFSLVELIVVIAIMAILAAVAIPTFAGFIGKANDAADVGFLNDVKYAANVALTAEKIKITSVEVTTDTNDGKVIASVTVYGEGLDANGLVIKETGNTNADADIKEAMDLIAGTVDWDYSLKTTDKNATYKLNAAGNALEKK